MRQVHDALTGDAIINLAILFLFWQTIWHAAECPEDGDARVWIAGANERHGSGVTEHLPIPFGSLYGRCWGGTLERLARDQPVLGQVERHGNKLADLAHGLPSGTKPDARRCPDDTRRA
jgi:hypothetical protein